MKHPAAAIAGAVAQRIEHTKEAALHEWDTQYYNALKDGTISSTEPMGKTTADRQFMGDDAFRHAYSSARLSQETSPVVANALGHGWEMLAAVSREKDNVGTNAADIGMDLHNNRVGREIAGRLGDDATPQEVRDAVIEAGRNGELILSTHDPRAMDEYRNAVGMDALSAVHDGYSGAKKGISGLFSENTQELSEGALPDAGKEAVVAMFQDKLEKALREEGDSPFFSFSEQQLAAGASFAENVSPEVLAAISDVAGYGAETTMTREQFDQHMASIEGLVGGRANELDGSAATQDLGNSEQQFASLDLGVAEGGANREAEQEAQMEMEMVA